MAEKSFTVADLQQHCTQDSCYLAINGKVYDVTTFLEEHPGGFDIILGSAGTPALPSPECAHCMISGAPRLPFCRQRCFPGL